MHDTCTTSREERNGEMEWKEEEGRGVKERGKVGSGAIVARLRHRERRTETGW